MDETQATTIPDEVNGWTLENDLGPTTLYQDGDIRVKKYTHIAENHDKGTFSVNITDGMRGEKIATDDDEDVVLSALLRFVDEHGPQDARKILDGDLEVDYGLEDTDDQDDEDDQDEDEVVDLSRPVTPESVKEELDVHGIGARAFGYKDLFETWHDVVSYWAGADGEFTGLEGVGDTTSEKLDAAVRDRLVPEIGRPDGDASESTTFKRTRDELDKHEEPLEAGDVVRPPGEDTHIVVETGLVGDIPVEDGGRDDLVEATPEDDASLDSTIWAPEKLDVVERGYYDLDQGDKDDVDAPDTYVLLACSSLKAADEDDDVDEDDALPAREQYRGSLFKKSKRYAETIDAPYAILSGKYGVLEPDDEISYYDKSVYDCSPDVWGEHAIAGLEELPLDDVDEIKVFAGKAYREPLAEYLESLDADVSVPVDGASGIGDMLSMMNDILDALDENADETDDTAVETEPDDEPDQVDGDEHEATLGDVSVDERADTLESLGLSGREAEVTAYKEQGLTHAEIADEIDSSKSSVDEYSRRAGKKLEKARKLSESVDVF